jgi:16S rRNA (guanine527-N7)-methyltransferase
VAERTQTDELRCGASALGLELSMDQATQLIAYMQLLERWNAKFNLVSRRDVGRLLTRHILDSLSVSRWVVGAHVLDIGSGAGLPGLPLAVANPGAQFTLVDRGERKTRFVQQAVMTLGLNNVDVECCAAEDLGTEPGFTSVVCRAVGGLSTIWQIAEPLLVEGGRLLFMNRTEAQLKPDALEVPTGSSVVREQVQIPGLPTPHEVLIVEALP